MIINGYYFVVYITTNKDRTKLLVDVTGNMEGRLYQFDLNPFYRQGDTNTDCKYLLYWESFPDAASAIKREQEINSFSYKKKKALIDKSNPDWLFLNDKDHMNKSYFQM